MGFFKKMFSGGEQQQIIEAPAPVVAPPTPMPIPDDKQVASQQKRKVTQRAARSGRASTILSQGYDDDLLGA